MPPTEYSTNKYVVYSLDTDSIEARERPDVVQMPESSADTFWGKGFLATALGTASPDRKKTHKGQKSHMDSWWVCCFVQHLKETKDKRHQHVWMMRSLWGRYSRFPVGGILCLAIEGFCSWTVALSRVDLAVAFLLHTYVQCSDPCSYNITTPL